VVEAARHSDLLINISGMLTGSTASPLFDVIPRRVDLDLDPAFNQLWQAVGGIDMRFEGHTHFVTVGSLLGTPGCTVPTCGRTWIPTLQPVVLSEWPATPGSAGAAWTTVGNWRGYGSVEVDGVRYGQRAHSFRRFMALPRRTRARLQPALAIHAGEAADLDALRAHDWNFVDPMTVARTPDAYRTFIQQSTGELGIAKSGYVASRCGWFSDRSVCYLASGRPVVAQETGFSDVLPTGDGLFAFTTEDEAVAALDRAMAGYDRHCRHARAIAEAHFSAERVLGALLDRVR
jgi:hypothetical protein